MPVVALLLLMFLQLSSCRNCHINILLAQLRLVATSSVVGHPRADNCHSLNLLKLEVHCYNQIFGSGVVELITNHLALVLALLIVAITNIEHAHCLQQCLSVVVTCCLFLSLKHVKLASSKQGKPLLEKQTVKFS